MILTNALIILATIFSGVVEKKFEILYQKIIWNELLKKKLNTIEIGLLFKTLKS